MKYGFVYMWHDTKLKRYYIGRHWGTEDDGYVCSSNSMRTNYSYRPETFKRRIVSRIYTSIEDLISEEQRWLNMIKPEECGIRYYNTTLKSTTPSMRNRTHSEETRRKISIANTGKPNKYKGIPRSEEVKQKLRENNARANLGKSFSEETKRKMSEALKGKKKTKEHVMKSATARTGQKRTEEARRKMSAAHKGTKKPWVKGRMCIRDLEKTRERMRAAALLREEIKRKKRNLNNEVHTTG